MRKLENRLEEIKYPCEPEKIEILNKKVTSYEHRVSYLRKCGCSWAGVVSNMNFYKFYIGKRLQKVGDLNLKSEIMYMQEWLKKLQKKTGEKCQDLFVVDEDAFYSSAHILNDHIYNQSRGTKKVKY